MEVKKDEQTSQLSELEASDPHLPKNKKNCSFLHKIQKANKKFPFSNLISFLYLALILFGIGISLNEGKMSILIASGVVLVCFMLPGLVFWNQRDYKSLFKMRKNLRRWSSMSQIEFSGKERQGSLNNLNDSQISSNRFFLHHLDFFFYYA